MDSGVMRILVAIDGSEPAALGLDLVAGVSWPADTEVVVAQAVETGTGLFGGAWPSVTMVQPDELEIAVEAQADQNVHRAAERLAASGLHVRPIVLRGRPATVVVDHARSLPADLVVVGSRGHGTIESMMLGSVSAEVVDHAPAPVLVTRSRQAKRIVLAWDGSPSATRAADVVATWPMFTAADVQVVTVAHAGVPWWTGFPEPGLRRDHADVCRGVGGSAHGTRGAGRPDGRAPAECRRQRPCPSCGKAMPRPRSSPPRRRRTPISSSSGPTVGPACRA